MGLFAAACRRAVSDAESSRSRCRICNRSRRAQLSRSGAGQLADLLINALPGAPIVTVNGASNLIGRSFQATNQGISRLVEAGSLQAGQRRTTQQSLRVGRVDPTLSRNSNGALRVHRTPGHRNRHAAYRHDPLPDLGGDRCRGGGVLPVRGSPGAVRDTEIGSLTLDRLGAPSPQADAATRPSVSTALSSLMTFCRSIHASTLAFVESL